MSDSKGKQEPLRAKRPRVLPRFLVGLEVRPAGSSGNDRGLGLFLTGPVSRGEPVLVFGGPVLTRADYLRFEDVERCVQTGPDTFLGPSGDLDDYTNHSCAPSTRVEVDRWTGRASLLAVEDLEEGVEVTFDYSTSQLDDPYLLLEDCRCQAARCRRVIRDFSHLSRREKQRLQAAGLLPWYVVQAHEAEPEPKHRQPDPD